MKEKAVDQNISEEDPTFPVVTLGVFPSHGKRVQCHPRFSALSEDPADFAQRLGHIGIDQRHPRNHHIKVLASVGKCLGGPADEPDFISQRAAQTGGPRNRRPDRASHDPDKSRSWSGRRRIQRPTPSWMMAAEAGQRGPDDLDRRQPSIPRGARYNRLFHE